MNPHKKLNKALSRLEHYPLGMQNASKEVAQRVKDAYLAVIEVVEREQDFRLNGFWKRERPYFTSIAANSDLVLAAHKGWAGRVVDMANIVLENKRIFDTTRAAEELSYASDYLLRNRHKFESPKGDSVLHRGLMKIRGNFAKAYKWLSETQIHILPKEIPASDFDKSKRFEELERLWEEKRAELQVTENASVPNDTALAVKPENQGVNGSVGPEKKCANIICNDGWVYGERWGSEDCPCSICNLEEYKKWLKVNHPEKLEDPTKAPVAEMVAAVAEKATHQVDPDIRVHDVCQPTTSNVPSATNSNVAS